MALPKWATTVTPFSKMLALSMLIIFPIIAFILGMKYQELVDRINYNSFNKVEIIQKNLK